MRVAGLFSLLAAVAFFALVVNEPSNTMAGFMCVVCLCFALDFLRGKP